MHTRINLLGWVVAGLVSAGAMAGAGSGIVTWGESTWDESTNRGTVEVMWQCDVDLYGFQFNVPGDEFDILSVSPLECDEGWSLNNSEAMLLCFMIEAGAQIDATDTSVGLVTMEFSAAEGDELSFIAPVFSAQGGVAIDVDATDVLVIGEALCPEDVYPAGGGDGVVDVNEVLAVLGDWGSTTSPYDVTGDGLIAVDDVLAILNAWGICA